MESAGIFTAINHVCVVTRDIERAVRVWADKYKVRPWHVYTFDTADITVSVDGEPTEFAMRAGLCHVGPTTRMEIIQPLDERSPYAQSLRDRGDRDHIHHVRMDIADYDDALGQLQGLGLPTTMTGRFRGGLPGTSSEATYFGTEDDLGFTVEVADRPADFVMPEPDFVYPPEDGVSPTPS